MRWRYGTVVVYSHDMLFKEWATPSLCIIYYQVLSHLYKVCKLTCIVDRQQQQLAHILQTLSSSEEYSQLTPQQLQTIAMSILVKEQQKQQVCMATLLHKIQAQVLCLNS